MDDPSNVELTEKVTKDFENGNVGDEFAASSVKGIRVVKAHKGFLLCDFIIPNSLSDENGNWHVGGIAILVDIIGYFASYSFTSYSQVTVDFSISYYSTIKVQEEVEVEAKVIGKKNKLSAVIVQVRKKENRELVAVGKLWYSSTVKDNGNFGDEFSASSLKGIRLVKARKDFILCDFVVHNGLSDENGNWHVGAIATLVDSIGSIVALTSTLFSQVTIDFSISYYSTAKVQEEVEVEAKVIGKKDKLSSVIVQVRKKENRELVAIGKLWFSSTIRDAKYQPSKL